MMSCIGVFHNLGQGQPSQPNTTEKKPVDLQLNYWKLPNRHWGYNRFLDLGILIYEAKDMDSISFYFPFQLSKNQLSDLGSVLVKDNLLSTLFNRPYTVESNPSTIGYWYASSHEEDISSFWIYKIDPKDIELQYFSYGTIVEIKIRTKPKLKKEIKPKGETSNYNLYLRFRIKELDEKCMNHVEPVSNDFFQSAFSRTDMVNLHINNVGEFAQDDYKEIASHYSFVSFSKIHFFFVCSSKEEAVSGNTTYSDTRLLESPKWLPYIGGNNPQQRKCIAYHWKVDGPKNDCNIFFRTIYSKADAWRILKYSLVALVLGVLASCFGSILMKMLGL